MVFKKHSGKYVVPGSNKMFMSLEEFTSMMQKAGLLNEFFGNREVGPQFNLSMMTNVDEVWNDRHLNMTYVEFLEALGRIADKFSMDNMEDHFPDYVGKSESGLDKKMESTFLVLIKYCLTFKDFKQAKDRYREIVEAELENERLGIIASMVRK